MERSLFTRQGHEPSSQLPLRIICLTFTSTLIFSMLACGGAVDAPPSKLLISSVVMPTQNSLVAQYRVVLSSAAQVSVEFGPTTSYGRETSVKTSMTEGAVDLLVAGMKPSTTYHMRAVVTSATETEYDSDQTFQTGSIPTAPMPQYEYTVTPGQQPTPGIQLVSGTGKEFALDTAGNVIWYYDYEAGGTGPWLTKLMPDGDMLMLLLFSDGTSGIREIDLAGTIVRELDLNDLNQKLQQAGYAIQLTAVDHDVLVLPNGHWLVIATHMRVYTDLPGYPGDTTVQGNAIIDVDQNNRPVWVWDAFDHLGVNRHPMNFPDWTHANSLFYSAADGNILISLRHQHWILKIDYRDGSGSGDVLWKLGYQGDFTLKNETSPADWFYAQHDANIISAKTTGDFQLTLFDNGNNRVLDYGGNTCDPNGGSPACFSTAPLLQVNENNMTANRYWAYQMPFSWWGGSSQALSNSNVIVSATAPPGLDGSTVQEVTQQQSPTVIWTLQLHGFASYRVEHLGSLYPGVQW